jgi:hypothetical protein
VRGGTQKYEIGPGVKLLNPPAVVRPAGLAGSKGRSL